MTRIAYVINFIVKGGPSAVVLNMIHNLDRSRFEPVLITLFEGSSPEIIAKEKKNGVTVIECGHKSRLQFILNGLPEYKHILESNHIDIVHGHGFVPDVMNARLNNGMKTISTLHNIMFEDYAFNYGEIKGAIYCRIHLWALRHLSRSACCSRSVYDVMKKYVPRCTYVENGIEDFSYACGVTRAKLGIPSDAVVFLYAGYLIPGKCVRILTGGFAKIHGTREYLLILGSGPEEEECRKLADDHVLFMGFQPNPYQYMAVSDIYTSASASEGFSISVLEALHCGLGLFLSDIPSHREVLDGAENLYLGEYFSAGDFAVKYKQLMTRFPEISREKIKKYQREKLSAAAMMSSYEKLYEGIM